MNSIRQAANRDRIMRDRIIEIGECFHDPVFHILPGIMIFQLMPANKVARHSNVESTRGNSPLEWQATWRSHFLQPEKVMPCRILRAGSEQGQEVSLACAVDFELPLPQGPSGMTGIHHFPMQKALKISPRISSTSTLPTTSPMASMASLRSRATNSGAV
ncbi:MAG: hypothetical protein ACI8T1_003119 [Verrucomicrobiales bacterium]|jgi:hypothetical protein